MSVETLLAPEIHPPDAQYPIPAVQPAGESAVSPAAPAYRQIGFSRPALQVRDLPTPEQAFNLHRLGWQEIALLALGPAVIAIGLSISSGEWLIGPMNVGRYGAKGLLWVVLVSIVLQVFYNVELGRYTLATGEPPVVGFGRTPPGYLVWVPLALISLFAAFILGDWAVSAGSSLFVLIADRPIGPADVETTRLIGIGLLVTVPLVLAVGRKIERTMEAVQGLFVPYILVGLMMVTLVVVPLRDLGAAGLALLIPARPPVGVDLTVLGAIAGLAAFASGLNFMFIGYYRDKGYGMGHYTGYLAGLFHHHAPSLEPVGKTFPENAHNARQWKRWFRLLLFDQWAIYFPGALLGIVLPAVLFGYWINASGLPVTNQDTLLFTAASLLGSRYGQLVSGWALMVGFAVLFTTQIAVLELLARNLTDALYAVSSRFRGWIRHDPRRFYFPALWVMIAGIGIVIQLNVPLRISLLSANLSNFAALVFPPALIYLNRRLPRPARIGLWSVLVLLLNMLFFGFFFINFLVVQLTGTPLVEF